MPRFDIEYSYKVPEWGTISLEADNAEQAEYFAIEAINDLYSEITDVVIEKVAEQNG